MTTQIDICNKAIVRLGGNLLTSNDGTLAGVRWARARQAIDVVGGVCLVLSAVGAAIIALVVMK